MSISLNELKNEQPPELSFSDSGVAEVPIENILPYKEPEKVANGFMEDQAEKLMANLERFKNKNTAFRDRYIILYNEKLDEGYSEEEAMAEAKKEMQREEENFREGKPIYEEELTSLSEFDNIEVQCESDVSSVEEIEEDEEENSIESEYDDMEETLEEKQSTYIEESITDDYSLSKNITEDEFFKDIYEDEEEDDEDELTQDEKKELKDFKESAKSSFTPIKHSIDFTKFKVQQKPISFIDIVSAEEDIKEKFDWIQTFSNTPFTATELSGVEINKLNPQNSNQTPYNKYRDIYQIIYNHIENPNKKEFDIWLKTTKFFDIDDIYFGLFGATFAGTGKNGSISMPYVCDKCGKIFMRDISIDSITKFKDDKTKNSIMDKLRSTVTESNISTNELQLEQISDRYVVGIKSPSIYNVIFEPSLLPTQFTSKYHELLGVLSFIDTIYVIDRETSSLVPIGIKPVKNDKVKTLMKKLKAYCSVISNLSSDQYYRLTGIVDDLQEKNDVVKYVLPETTCDFCGEKIEEADRGAENLLFTRHQLAAIANTSHI